MSELPKEQSSIARGSIAWMAGNSIAANLLMVLLLVCGVWTFFAVQKEVLPEFALDIVEIEVAYPGASPAEVEQGVLLPVEEAVKGTQGIKEMRSTAREGTGMIQIELVSGSDRMKAFQDIDQAVQRIRTFPDDAEEPEVRLRIEEREVISLGLFGNVDIWELRKLAEQLRDQLLNDPAITQVQLNNVPEYVTHVEIPQATLRKYGFTLAKVAEIIENSSRDVPAGTIDSHDGEILLRLKERKQYATEFESIPIVTADNGSVVRLGDIARISDGFEEEGFHSQFNQQPSVELEIFRIGTQSPLDIDAAVQRIVEQFKATLPFGVDIRIDSSAARDFQERLSLLLENGLAAVVIVLLILTLFLEFRLAFWIMMGMVISFVGGIAFLPLIGVSINMISMFAFIVVLGIVVDDAVVVGENIHEYRQEGKSPLEAAIAGTRDIAAPVVFSILTTIVAFLPVMFIPGTTGKFWWPLPAVVITVLLVSLVEALFILPAHLAELHPPKRRGRVRSTLSAYQQRIAKQLDRFISNTYRPFLELCLEHRYISFTASLTLLVVVVGYSLSEHMGIVTMPEVSADEIEAGVTLPVGTTRFQAAKVAAAITASTQRMFEKHNLYRNAEGIKTNVRRGNFIDVEIVLKPPDERDMTVAEIIQLWRDEIGDIEGVDQITFEAERGPGGWRDDITVDLSHSDINVLAKASADFFHTMKTFQETRDVNDSYDKGKLQLDFELLPEGRLLGVTPTEVGEQLRHAFYGALAMRQIRGTNEIEVRVKLPENERRELTSLEDFVIRTASGTEVPLEDIAIVRPGEAYLTIDRRDGRRVISVGMDVEPPRALNRVLTAIKTEVLPQLQADFPGITYSFEGSQAEMRESTQALWGGFALAMVVVYSLLAVAFRSYTQPLIVMAAIPFGIVGAVLGHMLLGYDLSLVSLMGVVALSGVVVNDSLIMVDYANRKSDGKLTAFEAIHQAGQRRFRPILLTTLTTFGGLTPIILETSRQAYHLIPMAISLGFGIVFATAIILVIVPCLYLILDDIEQAWKQRGSVPELA